MSLETFSHNRWIRAHDTSPDEIRRLLAIAARDIQQSQVAGLGPEWRFDISYNSALQSATAALAAAGHRAERQNKHLRTIECLAYTVGLPRADVDFLDACRRKRHRAVYEQVDAISDREADELIAFAIRLKQRVEDWILHTSPALLWSLGD